MSEIIFNGLNIEHISKSGLKNSYLSVSKDARIVLKTPKVSKSYILELLSSKEPWIRKQLDKIQLNPPKKINLEDEVMLFGDIYSIDVDEAKVLRESLGRIKVNSVASVKRSYNKFYNHTAREYIMPRISYFAQIMNVRYEDVKFRKMKSRWGSCSSKGVITINTELIKVKKELIDYVVVHELAHLVHMNHSKQFHSLVERYIQNSKAIRKELKSIYLDK